MEELKFWWEIFDKYGIVKGIVISIFLWDKILYPVIRRARGKYVGWKDLEKRLAQDHVMIEKCNEKLEALQNYVDALKNSLLEKDRKMDTLEIANNRLDRDLEEVKFVVRDIGSNLKTNNRLMGEVKDTNTRLIKVIEGINPKESNGGE